MGHYTELNQFGKDWNNELEYRRALIGKTFSYTCPYTGEVVTETIQDYNNGLFGCLSCAHYRYDELAEWLELRKPIISNFTW